MKKVNKSNLAGFLKQMGFDRTKIVSGRLENRIKVQKLVYFGKKFKLPLNYNFDIYLYGPYSSKLAEDYYSMSENEWRLGDLSIPEKTESVLHRLREKDALFLEIAATLDSFRVNNKNSSDAELIDVISNLKFDRLREKGKDRGYLESVLRDLSNIIAK